MGAGAERSRLADAWRWRRWGPYLAERAWGTVREDQSADGNAWAFLPHDQARSRAYRWSEEGMAGICDAGQTLCLALALWNGEDPILKERMFGLGSPEGNHGEDAKDAWWYLDSTPSHSWMRWRYHYPQRAFPYNDLAQVNAQRSRAEPEYELLDTGIFDDDRFWGITVDYAKASPTDVLMRIRISNHGPDTAVLHVLPTLWFRNTWSDDADAERPTITADGRVLTAHSRPTGRVTLACDGEPAALVCDNETDAALLFGTSDGPPHPKNAINDHVVRGDGRLAPDGRGTKAALHHVLEVPAGGDAEIRARLVQRGDPGDLGPDFTAVMREREEEADEFYASLVPAGAGHDRARILRQAFAGVLWSKQFYHLEMDRWLGPGSDLELRRNAAWRHLLASDVIVMPDKWEYPWYSAYDLAFTCVALARVDPRLAKEQLLLMCRETYMSPNGQLPATEWSFGDTNPPVQAWAGLRVFALDGGEDYVFLTRLFHKLLLHFTWVAGRRDSSGRTVFEGGGLEMGGASALLDPYVFPLMVEGSGGLLWTAMYSLHLMEIALTLARRDRSYEDLASKFFEHFARLAEVAESSSRWNDEDAAYYDIVNLPDGQQAALRVRTIAGLVPLCSALALDSDILDELPGFAGRVRWFATVRPELFAGITDDRLAARHGRLLVRLVGTDRLQRILERALDPGEFLSPYGLRSLSAHHRDHPFTLQVNDNTLEFRYEPGESPTAAGGGNENWRGPVWFPLNALIIDSLRRYHAYAGDELTVEHPAGSGRRVTLGAIADDLSDRLIALFERDRTGRRPAHGGRMLLQEHLAWRDHITFSEYFHGDTGEGLGASHQTGWTALVADLIMSRNGGA